MGLLGLIWEQEVLNNFFLIKNNSEMELKKKVPFFFKGFHTNTFSCVFIIQ